MKTIATLGPSVRLVVFQFLMRSAHVPAIIPPKRVSKTPPLPPVSGVEVLESTSGLDVSQLAGEVAFGTNYQLVDVWQNPHSTKRGMSFVRFVLCRRKYVRKDELFPDFVAKRKNLEEVFVSLIGNNLWATQGHINPYFEKDGTDTGHKVLMIGCAGRVPNNFIFIGGRDINGQGMGPKVLLSTLAPKLTLIKNMVILIEKR